MHSPGCDSLSVNLSTATVSSADGPCRLQRLSFACQDYEPRTLDLNTRLIKHPTQTFYLTATGDSMEGWGIFEGDLLVVDRSITPRLGHILVAMFDEEVLIKRYALYRGTPHLCSAHPHYPPLPLEGTDCQLWGVVRAVIHEYLP